MGLRELVAEVAQMCGHEEVQLIAFDLSTIGVSLERCHPTAAEYFCQCVPTELIDRPCFQLLGDTDIATHNQDYTPGCQILPFGFVTFADVPNGDAVAVDIADGRVYVNSHEVFYEDGISNYPNDPDPVSHESIIRHAEESYPSIDAFFESWRNELIALHQANDSFLQKASDDPNATDQFGNTLLIYYIRDGYLRMVKQEVARGADLELFSGEGRTPLGEAVVQGQRRILRYLIGQGADVNKRNRDGETPLMMAARYAQLVCMRVLLRAGADRNTRDVDGRTASDHLCVVHGTPKMAKLLKPPAGK